MTIFAHSFRKNQAWVLGGAFILEDHKMDDHRMITYSLPLIHNGVVYGILGTEVSTSYLINSYLMFVSGTGTEHSYMSWHSSLLP